MVEHDFSLWLTAVDTSAFTTQIPHLQPKQQFTMPPGHSVTLSGFKLSYGSVEVIIFYVKLETVVHHYF